MAVDVFDPGIFAAGVPHEALHRLRDHDPVSWQDEHPIGDWPAGPGFWAVTRYADVRHVLRSPQLFSSHTGATQIRDPEPEDLPSHQRMILNMDPPEHQRLRRLVTGAFTRRRLKTFAGRIAARAAVAVDSVIADGGCDLPVALTDEFPLANLAELLGVPEDEQHLLKTWTDRVIGYQDPEHGQLVRDSSGKPVNPRSPAMLGEMFDYASSLAERKRVHPADDVMTALVTARVEGERLGEDELRMFFFLLTIAGNDTVRSALPGGVLALLEHPQAHRRLLAEPELLDSAIEEMLRWHPPVLTFRRTATTDTEIGGHRIAAGEKVVVYHISAHYDERAFTEPFSFDIARTPNEHMAFGQGPHRCLGSTFARMQLRAFFSEFLPRLPALRLSGSPVRLTSNFINGISHLPLSW
ncbi:MAG: cytochrome P450 [Sciscionella sp.]